MYVLGFEPLWTSKQVQFLHQSPGYLLGHRVAGLVMRSITSDHYHFSIADSGSTERTAEGEAPGIALRHAAGPHRLWDVRIQLPPANSALQTISTSAAVKKKAKRRGEDRG